MSSSRANGAPPAQTYFEQQRAALIGDIAQNMEHVLQNINLVNRSLESVIAVGNEFSQVEGLWSQFENVMAQQPPQPPSHPHAASPGAGGATPTQIQQTRQAQSGAQP